MRRLFFETRFLLKKMIILTRILERNCNPIIKLDEGFQITQVGPLQPKLWPFYSEGSERMSYGRAHLAELTSCAELHELFYKSCMISSA